MKETALMHHVMLALTKIGARLLRNNRGDAWMGNAMPIRLDGMVHVQPGDVVIRNARRVSFGVGGNGGSDLIGFVPYTVKPSDVGRELAIFAAVEVKTDTGRVSAEQRSFLAAIETAGGIAVVARDPEKAADEVMRKSNNL